MPATASSRIIRHAVLLTASLIAFAADPSNALAQFAVPPPNLPPTPPTPPVQVFPQASNMASRFAATQALGDLGSNFLRRLGNQSTWGTNAALASNPGGGGASQAAIPAQTFRAWAEGYGQSARTGPQGTFVGDRRTTGGGVAGLGATLAPNFNASIWIDQGHTSISVPLALQSAALDLTQLGVNAAYTFGAWTFAAAYVHGFGDIDAKRLTATGFANSRYRGHIDAILGEASYYVGFGQTRIVPKAAVEYVRARTDAFAEFGGLDPITAGSANLERTRLLVGAEVGHYWIVDTRVIDLSGYAKFVDNVAQDVGSVQVSLGANSIAVQGVRESRYGADAGASASIGLTNALRVYFSYDGKFRDGFQQHQGTAGLEFKW